MQIFVPLIWVGSGISFFAGIQFCLFGLLRRQEQVFLAFGILCLLLGAYMVLSAQWYHAASVEEIAEIARYQMAIVCLVYPAFVWFLGLYLNERSFGKFLLALSAVFGLLFVVNLFSPYSFLYQQITLVDPIKLPWGEIVNDYRKEVAPIAWLYYAATYATFAWAFVRCIVQWKTDKKLRTASIIVYLIIQLLVVLHAELIDNAGLRSVYLGEFAFLILVVLVSVNLAKETSLRSAALERSVKELRKETERREEYENQLTYMVDHDFLTDLPNRRALSRRLDELLANGVDSNRHGAMLLIDIDNFKLINDSLGHDLGDQLLVSIAMRLKTYLPVERPPIRLGGDEFAILYGDLPGQEGKVQHVAVLDAKAICEAITMPYRIAEHELVISVCVGIAIIGAGPKNLSEIMKQADMALYRAKAAGPGSIEVFAPALKQQADRRLLIDKGMHAAIENGEIDVHFQPQVDIEGTVIGAEVLARWNDPALGDVSPAEFIRVSEETGLIHALGECVLEKACQHLKRWEADRLYPPPRLSVNVSPWQLETSGFVKMVTEVLAETGVAAPSLNLEITESTFMREIKSTSRKMNELGEMGITFSIDDFGTGYSALAWLKRLSLNELKIDRMFISDMLLLENDRLIETILAIARYMDLQVVAEGVETAAQRGALEVMGCRCFQGFLISRPLPEQEFTHWMRRHYGVTRESVGEQE